LHMNLQGDAPRGNDRSLGTRLELALPYDCRCFKPWDEAGRRKKRGGVDPRNR